MPVLFVTGRLNDITNRVRWYFFSFFFPFANLASFSRCQQLSFLANRQTTRWKDVCRIRKQHTHTGTQGNKRARSHNKSPIAFPSAALSLDWQFPFSVLPTRATNAESSINRLVSPFYIGNWNWKREKEEDNPV